MPIVDQRAEARGPSSMAGNLLLIAGWALLLGIVEFRVAALAGDPYIAGPVERLMNITAGRPDWIQWQSRLLTPWMVRWIGEWTGGDVVGLYPGILLGHHVAKNVLFGMLLWGLKRDVVIVAKAMAAFSFLLIALVDALRMFPWDYVDIMVFTVFLFGVFRKKGDGFFAALFLPAILNRESALFIPLWMMVDGGPLLEWDRFELSVLRVRKPRRFLVGAGLLAAGGAAVILLRRILLVQELAPMRAPDLYALGWNHLGMSLRFLSEGWLDFTSRRLMGFTRWFVVGVPLLVALSWRRMDGLLRGLCLILLSMEASVLVFGSVWDLRLYVMMIPILVLAPFYHFHLRAQGDSGGSPSANAG